MGENSCARCARTLQATRVPPAERHLGMSPDVYVGVPEVFEDTVELARYVLPPNRNNWPDCGSQQRGFSFVRPQPPNDFLRALFLTRSPPLPVEQGRVIHIGQYDRNKHQRQKRRGNQATHDGMSHRGSLFASVSKTESHR